MEKKSIWAKLLVVIMALCCTFALVLGVASCGGSEPTIKSVSVDDNGKMVVTYTDDSVKEIDLKGAKGDKGDKGEKGETGAAGQNGATGATGAAGQDGKDGVGVKDVKVADGYLVVTLTDNNEYKLSLNGISFGCAADEHDWKAVTIGDPATCTNAGTAIWVCSKCKLSEIHETDKLPHHYDAVDADVDYAFDQDDNLAYVRVEMVCDMCNEETLVYRYLAEGFESDKVDPTEEVDGTVDFEIKHVPATLESAGGTYLNWSVENGTYKGVVVLATEDALPHLYLSGSMWVDITKTYTVSELADANVIYFANRPTVCTEAVEAGLIANGYERMFIIKVKADHEYELNEEKSNLNPAEGEDVELVFICKNCKEELKIKATDYEIKDVPATCAAEGNKTLYYTYTGVDGKEKVGEKVLATYAKSETTHYYNDTVIDTTKELTFSDLDKIFGTEEERDVTIFNKNSITCAKAGRAEFTCTKCGEDVFLDNVIADHKYAADIAASTITEEKVVIVYKCTVCKEATYEEELKAGVGYRVVETAASCAGNGNKTLYYTVEGEEEEKSVVLETYEADLTTHWVGEAKVTNTKTYRMSELAAIFGDRYNEVTYFNPAAITCTKEGNASFVCDKCEETILIKVLADHVWEVDGEPAEEVRTDDEGNKTNVLVINFKCSVCKEATDKTEIPAGEYEIIDEPATCAKAGRKYIQYSYMLNGEKVDDEKTLTEYPINANNHEYNEKAIETSKTYRFSELKAIFGEEYENEVQVFSANTITCTKAGKASFACAKCHQNILIDVLDDHKMAVVGEPAVDEEAGIITINLKCENCDVTDVLKISAKEYKIEEKTANCEEAGYKKIVYSYLVNGEKVEDVIVLANYPVDLYNHIYGEFTLSTEETYTEAKLKEIFGDKYGVEEGGLRIFGNTATCDEKKHGYAYFKCELCEQDILIQIREEHVLVLDKAASVSTADLIYRVWKCANCDKVVEFKAEKPELITVEPTCTAKGYKYFVIEVAELEYEEKVIVEEFEGNAHHVFADGTPIDLDHVYTYEELEAIYGEDLSEAIRIFKNDPDHAAVWCNAGEHAILIKIDDAESFANADL